MSLLSYFFARHHPKTHKGPGSDPDPLPYFTTLIPPKTLYGRLVARHSTLTITTYAATAAHTRFTIRAVAATAGGRWGGVGHRITS